MPLRHRAPIGRARPRARRGAALLAAGALLSAAVACGEPERGEPTPCPAGVLPLAEVRPGMTGYGLTVFHGSTPDTFQVRVLGVQWRARPAGNVILVEVKGPGLELSGIPQGMSGSPVWLDGRFAGAVAFSWEGALKPIGGLTPAEELLALPAEPAAAAQAALDGGVNGPDASDLLTMPGRAAPLAARLFGGLLPEAPAVPAVAELERQAERGWPDVAELARRVLPALSSARPPGGTELCPLSPALHCRPAAVGVAAQIARSGTDPASGPAKLVPGAAVAVALVLGDAQLGAIGTVSWVDGDRVIMFGHPLLQAGPLDLPLAAAEIVGVFPSRQMSFKLGDFGPVIGSVHHDLRAGVAGRLGAAAALVPLTVEVERDGAAKEHYAFQVARDPRLTPALLQWCLHNALLACGDDLSRQTIRWSLATDWRRADGAPEPLEFSGIATGPNSAAELAPDWLAPLQLLLDNRHEPLELTAARARLRVVPGLASAWIADAAAPDMARAGNDWPVTVALQPRRGAATTLHRELALPARLAPGEYRLLVASSRDVFALEAQRVAERFADRSLAATLALVRAPRSAADLEFVLYAPGRGVTVDGRELAELPGSVAAALRADGTGRVAPARADIVLRERVPGDSALEGAAILNLIVLPPALPGRQEERP